MDVAVVLRSPLYRRLLGLVLLAPTLSTLSCSVVSVTPPQPQPAADEASVDNRSGTLLVLAANSLDLVDQLSGAIDAVARKTPPTSASATPYSLIEQIITESGIGAVTHPDSQSFTYRAQSKAGLAMTSGNCPVNLVISGTEGTAVGSTTPVAVDKFAIELDPPGQPAQSFTLLTRVTAASNETYTLDFSAIGALMTALAAFDPSAPSDTLAGQLQLSLQANTSTLSGSNLTVTNDAYTLAITQLTATSNAGTTGLASLVLTAQVTATGANALTGTVNVNTTNAGGGTLPVQIKAGFTPQQGATNAGS